MKKFFSLFFIIVMLTACSDGTSVFVCEPFDAFVKINCRSNTFIGRLRYFGEDSIQLDIDEPAELSGYTAKVYHDKVQICYEDINTEFLDSEYQIVLTDLYDCILSLDKYPVSSGDGTENITIGECSYTVDKCIMRIKEINTDDLYCEFSY